MCRLHYNTAMTKRNLRLALSEWGVIVSVPLSVACFIYWVVSIASDRADFQLSFARLCATQMATADGTITFCDNVANLEVIELIEKGIPFTPAPNRTYRWNIPGFRFRCLTFGSGTPVWSLNFSVLYPAFLSAFVAGFCIHEYRRQFDAQSRTTNSSQPTSGAIHSGLTIARRKR
jgi:hypothetical protein